MGARAEICVPLIANHSVKSLFSLITPWEKDPHKVMQHMKGFFPFSFWERRGRGDTSAQCTFASWGRSVRPQYVSHEVPLYLKKGKLVQNKVWLNANCVLAAKAYEGNLLYSGNTVWVALRFTYFQLNLVIFQALVKSTKKQLCWKCSKHALKSGSKWIVYITSLSVCLNPSEMPSDNYTFISLTLSGS